MRHATPHSRAALAVSACFAALLGGAVVGLPTSAHARNASLQPVPILMYHVIGEVPAGAPFPELYVSRSDFASEMSWLARHGYTGVTLDAVYKSWRYGTRLPTHPIVLSFDDGYAGDYLYARPILRARKWPGVLNLEVRKETYPGGLSPQRIRALLAAGWEVDAHTMTHPDLTAVDSTQLHYEVAGSRASISRRFHVPVNFFCYPAGRYDATVIAAVQAAGFLGATTTQFGLARPADLFTLDRVRVNGSDGAAGLGAKLRSLGQPG
jgi:peptidoglycan/xylan/chitin deacetylase (PgdA/CDA1 family)